MIKLRDYQQKTNDLTYEWFMENPTGNPCVVLPTGAGKSICIADFIISALKNWSETRVLMLTHSKKLVQQNSSKIRALWPNAPMGIYSAGLKKRELGEPITFAGIQSVRNRACQIGHIDLILVDECHAISHKEEGGYRKLIKELTDINPSLRVIGYSATPHRTGHGVITDGDAIFDELIEPVSIQELVSRRFLSPLRSKLTQMQLDVSGVKKRCGDYIQGDLQRAVNTVDYNEMAVSETIAQAGSRRHWLFFCSGIDHAENICTILNREGINSACLTSKTPLDEQERILKAFESGEYKALTNASMLTTGYDFPDIDLIAMLRPTKSAGLYVQCAGRGLRIKSHTDHCLVLDFAGVVATHGPITNVQPPRKAGKGDGNPPIRVCDDCFEICHASARVCSHCGKEFPAPEKAKLRLRSDDIMGLEPESMKVTSWNWSKHVSKKSGKEMLKVKYYGALSDEPVTEYVLVNHEGQTGERAKNALISMARKAGVILNGEDLADARKKLTVGNPPKTVEYRKSGKFFRVLNRSWV